MKPANKLTADDTKCISTIEVNRQIMTVIGHVLIKFTHLSRGLMVVYKGASVLEHFRAVIILRFPQMSITREHSRTYNLLLLGFGFICI